MVVRVQKISEGYGIVLTEDALRELNLAEGVAVELRPVAAETENSRPEIRYLSLDEGLSIFRETEPEHRQTYEQLAK
jgi:antitoxin component of MazEF toxin-antitoxin module